MSDPTRPASNRSLRARLGLPLVIIGLLVGIGGLLGMMAPSSVYFTDHEYEVDLSLVNIDSERSWVMPYEIEGVAASDMERTSPLVMYEDDRPLVRQDNHGRLREEGLGLFSHWGKNLWFSTSDGSDPRENGRRYRMVHPRAEESSLRSWVGTLAAAGAVLTLIGLVMAPRVRSAVIVAVVVAAAFLYVRTDVRAVQLRETVSQARDQVFRQLPDEVRPVAQVGNVTRLAAEDFTAVGSLPPPTPPSAMDLAVEGETGDGGLLRMKGKKGSVTGTPPVEFRAHRLAEILVSGLIPEGRAIQLEVTYKANRSQTTSFQVPIEPSPEPQILRIVRPLGLYAGPNQGVIESVVLRAVADDDQTVLCRIDDVSLVDEIAMYRSSGWGEERFQVAKTMRQAWWQSVPGTFRVPLPAEGGSLLKGAVSLRAGPTKPAATLEVRRDDGVGAPVLLTCEVPPGEDWLEFRLELPEPRPASLLFTCSDLTDGGILALSGLRVVDTSRRPQRVMLTLMDTLRADMIQPYSESAPPTPHLNTLAEQGVVFENTISQCFWTRPSMASIMSSRYVQATGVHAANQRLPASYPTMIEAFAEAGFFTVGTMSNSNAASDAGLDQGWDEITEQWITKELIDADAYCRQFAEPRLADLMEEDLLVYVHLMDAHGPYGPGDMPEGWVQPEGKVLPFDKFLDREWVTEPTDAGRIALYRDDVRRLDQGWGEFLERMLTRWDDGDPDGRPAIVAVMSDHGEFLGEYDQWSHIYYNLLPEVVHVPLLIRAPGQLPEGVRVRSLTQNVDVAPTLLELAGIDQPTDDGWDGTSLVAAAHGASADRLAISSGGATAALFAIYGDECALIGRKQRLETIMASDGARWTDTRSSPDDESLLEDWVAKLVESSFLETWSVYRRQGNDVRDVLWSDVDQTASVIDPDALRQLEEMGYLER
jgi:hypothetical protein